MMQLQQLSRIKHASGLTAVLYVHTFIAALP